MKDHLMSLTMQQRVPSPTMSNTNHYEEAQSHTFKQPVPHFEALRPNNELSDMNISPHEIDREFLQLQSSDIGFDALIIAPPATASQLELVPAPAASSGIDQPVPNFQLYPSSSIYLLLHRLTAQIHSLTARVQSLEVALQQTTAAIEVSEPSRKRKRTIKK